MNTLMSSLLEHANDKKFRHCLLEMPTGTGKTLCLLTTIMAFMEKYPK